MRCKGGDEQDWEEQGLGRVGLDFLGVKSKATEGPSVKYSSKKVCTINIYLQINMSARCFSSVINIDFAIEILTKE